MLVPTGSCKGPKPDRQVIGVARLAHRDVAPVEQRQPHVDRDHRQAVGALAGLLRFEQAGDGLHRDMVGLALVHHQRGDAARGVAAGPGLAAVGIVDAHEDVGVAARSAAPARSAGRSRRRAGDAAMVRRRSSDRSSAVVRPSRMTKSLPSPCILRNGVPPMPGYMAVRPGQRNERRRRVTYLILRRRGAARLEGWATDAGKARSQPRDAPLRDARSG